MIILIAYWYSKGDDIFPQYKTFGENATDEEIIRDRIDPKMGEFLGYETQAKF